MKEELIASITKLVVEKLSQEQPPEEPEISLWSKKPKAPAPAEAVQSGPEKVQFKPLQAERAKRDNPVSRQLLSDSAKLEKRNSNLKSSARKHHRGLLLAGLAAVQERAHGFSFVSIMQQQ